MWGLTAAADRCPTCLAASASGRCRAASVARVLLGISARRLLVDVGGHGDAAGAGAADAARHVDHPHRRFGGDRLRGAGRRLCRRHLGMANGLHDRGGRRRRGAAGADRHPAEAAAGRRGKFSRRLLEVAEAAADQGCAAGRPAGRLGTFRRLHLCPRRSWSRCPLLDIETISLVLLAYGIGGFFGNFAGGFVAERSLKAAVGAGAAADRGAATAAAGTPRSLAGGGGDRGRAWGFAFGAVPVGCRPGWCAPRPTRPKAPAG